MDKNNYGTYEYLSTNNVDDASNQFFVVQEDGTFLINRQVQYVTQVQDVKEVLDDVQPCTVYDVTQQQFYVDVENSSELISVSDQLIIPPRPNNLYANNFLLPSESITNDTANNHMDQDISDEEYKPNNTQMDIDVDTNINKDINNYYTEITLNDEQYSQLEKKGWILLENSDKIFMLDTMGGLRDISTDEKLIEKLKTDNESYDLKKECSSVKMKNTNKYDKTPHDFPVQQDTVEYVIRCDDDNVQNLPFVITDKEECSTSQQIQSKHYNQILPSVTSATENKEKIKIGKNEQENPENVKIFLMNNDTSDSTNQDNNVLRIKTKLSFKDFPNKIVLGKTINGKKLVAKVKKKKIGGNEVINSDDNDTNDVIAPTHSKDSCEESSQQSTKSVGLDEMEFTSILEQSLLTGSNEKPLNAKDFEATELLITQLIEMPAFKTSILSAKLCVTKVKQKEDLQGNIIGKSKPTLVTGQIRLINNQWRFVHIPDMLLKHMHAVQSGSNNTDTVTTDTEVLHIHVLETKQKRAESNIVKTAVSVVKINLPQNFNVKTHKTNKIFACAACAALYKSEQGLKDHQKIHCTNNDVGPTSVDVENIKLTNDEYYVENGKEKIYCCMQCNARFKRLSFCKNHIKAHPPKNQIDSQSQENETESQINGIYKCKMCPCTYFHSSTLSKHIVTKHIQVI